MCILFVKNKEKVIAFLLSVSIILFMQPYFTWVTSEYYNIVSNITKLYLITMNIILILTLLKTSIKKTNLILGLFTSLFLLFVYITGAEDSIGKWGILLQYTIIIMFFLLKDLIKKLTLVYSKQIFALMLIPSIIIFLLLLINIKPPFTILHDFAQSESERIYLKYFCSVFTSNKYNLVPAMRLCGFLDEPGALGTYCAFFLCADNFNLKNNYNKIIFIAACMTVSTAFFLLCIVFIVVSNIRSLKKVKLFKVCLLFGGFVTGIGLFLFQQVGLGTINYMNKLLGKISFNDFRGSRAIWDTIVGKFGTDYCKYILGNGYLSINMDGNCSVIALIHDIGFLGCFFLLLWIMYITREYKSGFKSYAYMTVMLCSVLQRPYIITIPFILIYVGGLVNLKQCKCDRLGEL